MNVLTRDEFRSQVFERDGHRCVVCRNPAKDAHHILERRLWDDGGYYLDNGVSLCTDCHIKAEQTVLSCEEIRNAAGIDRVVLPEHLYSDVEYDKWGNMILADNRRIQGELFHDESVQKILGEGGVLNDFAPYVRYPRTYHLPWSNCTSGDDKVHDNTSFFDGKEVVVTVKMDGENSSLYPGYMHPRSINYSPHPSRSWVKSLHAKMGYNIPNGWRVCGENLFAKHSIHYHNLQSYFLMFSIWNDKNWCLSWDDTIEWAQLLDLQLVSVLYRGIWDEDVIRNIPCNEHDGDDCEGYVVRVSSELHYSEFRRSFAKYVRPDHVNTSHNWKYQAVVKNEAVSNL